MSDNVLAIELCRRELDDLEKRLQQGHPAITRSRADFAMELYLAGRTADALREFERALEAYALLLIENPTAYTFMVVAASVHDVLADAVLEDLGRVDDAREHAAAALALMRRLRDAVEAEIAGRQGTGTPPSSQLGSGSAPQGPPT